MTRRNDDMPKSRCFDRETIENVRDALANAEDPPSQLSARQAVEELADLIREKRAAGWRRQDIVNFLKQHGLDIPEATLRTYASARHASEPADADSRTGRPQGIDAGIERGPGASDTRPAPSRPATRRPGRRRVAHIEQDDV